MRWKGNCIETVNDHRRVSGIRRLSGTFRRAENRAKIRNVLSDQVVLLSSAWKAKPVTVWL